MNKQEFGNFFLGHLGYAWLSENTKERKKKCKGK